MMRRHLDTIDVIGANGDFCRISPPGYSWGPELAPGSTGLYDMPVQTNWGNYAFGQYFSSWKPKRRDVVWTVNIMNPDTGTRLDQDEHLWHLIYSRWRAMFPIGKQTTIVYTSLDGPRTLSLTTLDTAKPFSAMQFEGKDPHLFAYGSVVQTMAAELPFYVGTPEVFTAEFPNPGNDWARLPYFNPGNVDIWPEWEATWGCQLQLPDYSFGNEVHGRGLADSGKTVLTPTFAEGDGSVSIFTRPDLETYISEMDTPVSLRAPGGQDFEYPIPPGAGDSDPANGCVVRAIGVGDTGAAVKLTLPRWYDTPFSTPTVV